MLPLSGFTLVILAFGCRLGGEKLKMGNHRPFLLIEIVLYICWLPFAYFVLLNFDLISFLK